MTRFDVWEVTFARPDALRLLVPFVLLLILASLLKPRRYRAHSLIHLCRAREMRPSALRHLPMVLVALGVVGASLALLDPRVRSRERVTRLEGLEVALVVDLSLSMKDPIGGFVPPVFRPGNPPVEIPAPTRPTRMEAMRRALARIISQRKEDRLAVVVFSENGYIVSPPTRDHVHLAHYLEMIEPDLLKGEGRTAIGEGVASAMGLFERQAVPEGAPRSGGRVIVVFTDGENNYGRDPIETVREARRRGYRVYLVGLDLPQGYNRKESQTQLVNAVVSTSGRYFDARNEEELRQANDAIDRIEKGVFVERTIERDVPIFQLFVVAALGALYLGLALGAIPYFVDVT